VEVVYDHVGDPVAVMGVWNDTLPLTAQQWPLWTRSRQTRGKMALRSLVSKIQWVERALMH
jgi:hypothetical protein